MQQGLAKTAIWAVAVVCVALIMATGDVEAPPQAKVTEVTGTVDVGNFPVRQSIFAGLTAATFTDESGVLDLNRACDAELSGSRICAKEELMLSIPPPAGWADRVLVVARFETLVVQERVVQGGTRGCITSDGASAPCKVEVSETGLHPIACCGF